MDYVPGGDMMALLIKKGIFEERLAQFYIAELTLALQVNLNLIITRLCRSQRAMLSGITAHIHSVHYL